MWRAVYQLRLLKLICHSSTFVLSSAGATKHPPPFLRSRPSRSPRERPQEPAIDQPSSELKKPVTAATAVTLVEARIDRVCCSHALSRCLAHDNFCLATKSNQAREALDDH
jgi:hypothetical protein